MSERTRGDSAMSDESQTDPPVPGQRLSKSASPPQGEASIPRALAQEYRLLSARGTFPGSTQGSGAPACIRGTSADLPGG